MNNRPTGDMVQVHLLTAYPAALLNRDDAGLAKRIPFGGTVRVRVSSQCLKKHWREASLIADLGDLAVRSERIFRLEIAEPLIAQRGESSKPVVEAIARHLMAVVMSSKEGAAEHDKRPLHTKQLAILTRAEVDWLKQAAEQIYDLLAPHQIKPDPKAVDAKLKELDRDLRKDLKEVAQALPASLDTALFGRMVTSDLIHRVDAAVSVAHAFTTHAEEAETDYFTAVDTLKTEEDDAGAGLIQDTELTSGVFYTYAVIDMNQLRDNLVGFPPEFAETLARQLVAAMAKVSPGAKKGSTAPYAYAEMVLLERGPEQPRTLANAFLEPVRANGLNLLTVSAEKLLQYRQDMTAMYGAPRGVAALSVMHKIDTGELAGSALEACLGQVFQAEPIHA
ncbi:MAG: type I-E CRISPR-associated protein Cas7/Cse4/CasC [Armatimonadetes bacterium]|nr:type I-E CRISPR-associated protein Cas7/Cse4/CasC [Armatimonadota bacterium]